MQMASINSKSIFRFTFFTVSLFSVFTFADAKVSASPSATGDSSQRLIKPEVASSAPADKKATAAAATEAKPVGDTGGEKVSTLPTHVDDLKTQRVLNSLAKQAGWFPEIVITVVDGMVTLNGKVKNADQLKWLAATADRLPSVVAVINKAEVEQPPVTDMTPFVNEVRSIIEKTKKMLPLIALALVLSTAFYLTGRRISRWVNSVWSHHTNNPFLLSTVTKITMLPIWALFFYLVLETAGLSGLATTIIGGTGAASLVIGFAFKDIAENYLSGLLLAMRSPFTKGDEIQVGAFQGFVQSLDMRGTTITDYNGNMILVPNSIVIQSVIRNKTTNPVTNAFFNIKIGCHDNAAEALDLIRNTLDTIPGILKTPKPAVIVDDLSSATMNIKSLFWFNAKTTSGDDAKSQAINQVKEALLAKGFSLPDTSREVVFTDALRVQVLQNKEEAAEFTALRNAEKKDKANANLKEKPSETSNDFNSKQEVFNLSKNLNIMNKSEQHGLLTNN